MNTLRLKTGEKIAIDEQTTRDINLLVKIGAEIINPIYNICFWRDNFQSITPSTIK